MSANSDLTPGGVVWRARLWSRRANNPSVSSTTGGSDRPQHGQCQAQASRLIFQTFGPKAGGQEKLYPYQLSIHKGSISGSTTGGHTRTPVLVTLSMALAFSPGAQGLPGLREKTVWMLCSPWMKLEPVAGSSRNKDRRQFFLSTPRP